MAEKQTKKRVSGGKTTGKSSGSRKCTSKSSRAKANARTPVRREVGAGICLVLALCTTLGCLGIQGAPLSLLISLFRGLIGKGLYILPFSFVMGFLILLLHDGRPVALRVTCSMLLAVTIGALVQLVGGQEGADWSASMLADLWDGGLDGSCAGVVAGLLAQTLELIISRAGAVIVLLAALALELITSLNMTVRGIITAIKNRPRIEYDEPKLEHPDPAERIVNHVATRHIEHVQQEQERRRAKASEFDLPVDEPPLPVQEAKPRKGKAPMRPDVFVEESRRAMQTASQKPEQTDPGPDILAERPARGQLAQQAQEQEQQNQYEALMEQGTQLCETDPEQALGCFEQAQALYPEESAPYISYAYALYCAQDYERCISYIEDELGLGKAYDIEAQSQLSEILGAAYFECDDYAAAASFFRLSTAGGDITVNAQRDYAVSLGRLGDIDAADEILSQMYAAGASGDVTDYVQAEIDYAKKEYLDAESGFQAVLNQTQDIALQKRALRSLAEVYRDCAALVRTGSSPIGNPATKAVEVLANGIETYGLRYDSTIWEMLALAYFEAYHTDPSVPQSYLRKAGECFNRVLELGVTKSYLYSNLYTIYYELQEYDLAEQTLDAYAAQYPKDYEPYAFRAMLYITLENRKEQSARDYSAAVEAYETAGQLLRSDDDATYYQQLQSLIQQLQKEGWING